jgi:hypothetical protein
MRELPGRGMIPGMTRRPPTHSKVLLIADGREGAAPSGAPAIRRFRLARLRLDGREPPPSARYEHLKRVFY